MKVTDMDKTTEVTEKQIGKTTYIVESILTTDVDKKKVLEKTKKLILNNLKIDV